MSSIRDLPYRLARAVLCWSVRGRAERGDEWGEAMLAELEETRGLATIGWAASGAWLSWRRRLGRRVSLSDRRFRLGLAALAGLALSVSTSQAVALAYVPSTSMEPTLRPGDRVVVDEFGFRLTGLRHGDVVQYNHDGHRFQKRVVGLPGDEIRCAEGLLYRNGGRVNEPYLVAGTATECSPVTVPDGAVYVLGDAREISKDSRHYGPVPLDGVTGRMITSLRFPFS